MKRQEAWRSIPGGITPAPLDLWPDETAERAAARLDMVAAHLTVFAEEHAARSRAFRERADEARANAASLRGVR